MMEFHDAEPFLVFIGMFSFLFSVLVLMLALRIIRYGIEKNEYIHDCELSGHVVFPHQIDNLSPTHGHISNLCYQCKFCSIPFEEIPF